MSKVLPLALLTPLLALGGARALVCEFPSQALPTVARHVLILDAAATADPGLRSALTAYLEGIEGEVWLMGYGAGLRTRERLSLPAQRAEAARLLASLAATVAEEGAAAGGPGRHTAASLQQALSVLRRDPETLTRVLLVSGGEDTDPLLPGMVPAARGFAALRGPLDSLDWVALGHAIPESERAVLTDGSVNLSVYPRGSVPELWRRPDLNPVLRLQRGGQLRLNTDSPFTVRVAADGSAVAAGGGALSLGRDQLPPGPQEVALSIANVQRLPENTPVLLCFDSAAGQGRQLLWLGSVPQVSLVPGALASPASLGTATPGVLSPGQLHALNPRAGTVLRRGRSVTLRYQVGEGATLTLPEPPPGWSAEVASPQALPGEPGAARLRRGGTFAVRLRNVSSADETWTPLVTLRADSGATYALPLAVLQSPAAPDGRAGAALWLAGAALLGALLLLLRPPRPLRSTPGPLRPAAPPRSSPLAAAPEPSAAAPNPPPRSGSAATLRSRLASLRRPSRAATEARPTASTSAAAAPPAAPFRAEWLGTEGGAVLLGAEGLRRTVAPGEVGEQPGLRGLELLALGHDLHLHRLPPGLGLRERGRPVRPGEALNPGRVYRLSEGERGAGRPQALLFDGDTLHVYDALQPHSAELPPGRSDLGWLLSLPELAGLQWQREADAGVRLLAAPAGLHPHRRDVPLRPGEELLPGVLYSLDPLRGPPASAAPARVAADARAEERPGERLVVKPAAPNTPSAEAPPTTDPPSDATP